MRHESEDDDNVLCYVCIYVYLCFVIKQKCLIKKISISIELHHCNVRVDLTTDLLGDVAVGNSKKN